MQISPILNSSQANNTNFKCSIVYKTQRARYIKNDMIKNLPKNKVDEAKSLYDKISNTLKGYRLAVTQHGKLDENTDCTFVILLNDKGQSINVNGITKAPRIDYKHGDLIDVLKKYLDYVKKAAKSEKMEPSD